MKHYWQTLYAQWVFVDRSSFSLPVLMTWPLVTQALLLLIWFGVCSLVSYYVLVSPMQQTLSVSQQQWQRLQAQQQAIEVQTHHQAQYQQQQTDIEHMLTAEQQTINVFSLPSLLDTIMQLVADAQVTLHQLTVESEYSQPTYTELPLRIKVQGPFYALQHWLRQLTQLPYRLAVSDMQWEAVDNHASNHMILAVTLVTYHEKTVEEKQAVIKQLPGLPLDTPLPDLMPYTAQKPVAAHAMTRQPFATHASALTSVEHSSVTEIMEPAILPDVDVSDLNVMGIIFGATDRMALIRDPKGHIHSVTIGHVMGRQQGRITRVSKTAIYGVQNHHNQTQPFVLPLQAN